MQALAEEKIDGYGHQRLFVQDVLLFDGSLGVMFSSFFLLCLFGLSSWLPCIFG